MIVNAYQLRSVHWLQVSQPLVDELLKDVFSTTDSLEKGNTEGYRKISGQNKNLFVSISQMHKNDYSSLILKKIS